MIGDAHSESMNALASVLDDDPAPRHVDSVRTESMLLNASVIDVDSNPQPADKEVMRGEPTARVD